MYPCVNGFSRETISFSIHYIRYYYHYYIHFSVRFLCTAFADDFSAGKIWLMDTNARHGERPCPALGYFFFFSLVLSFSLCFGMNRYVHLPFGFSSRRCPSAATAGITTRTDSSTGKDKSCNNHIYIYIQCYVVPVLVLSVCSRDGSLYYI